MRDNIIVASDWTGVICRTDPVWQGDYGIILRVEDMALPSVFEVHFTDVSQGPAVTAVGADGEVEIPAALLAGTRDIVAYIYLHTGENDGETVLQITIPLLRRAEVSGETPTPAQQSALDQAVAVMEGAAERAAEIIGQIETAADLEDRLTSLDGTPLAHRVVEAAGIPVYVSAETLADYAAYGLTRTGWYVFARVYAPEGSAASAGTVISGAEGFVLEVGADHVDLAVRFKVAAASRTVTVEWAPEKVDRFVFKATDLAVRNLDYRTTFYIYDLAPFTSWQYALTADATFAADKNYYTFDGETYTLAEVTATEAVPAFYTLEDTVYTQATGVFEDGVTYYTKSGTEYTEATVTAGEAIPAYYNHSKLHIEGMARNVTYQFDEVVDCPSEIVLPAIEDDGHGAWFEMRFRHSGSFSSTLLPEDETVKIATEHTHAETAGMNMVDLHYLSVAGTKIWRFMNTHSTIPA